MRNNLPSKNNKLRRRLRLGSPAGKFQPFKVLTMSFFLFVSVYYCVVFTTLYRWNRIDHWVTSIIAETKVNRTLQLLVDRHFENVMVELALDKSEPCDDKSCVFSQIKPQIKEKEHSGDKCILVGDGQDNKATLNMTLLYDRDECVVFAAGISYYYTLDTYFEKEMAKQCRVFAFDCTVRDKDRKMEADNVNFSPICIGDPTSNAGNIGQLYMNQAKDEFGFDGNSNEPVFQFKSLLQLSSERHLDRIDLLKFDIEGHEWDFFSSVLPELWKFNEDLLPGQISFELHTKWADPYFVPQDLVKDKGRDEVNELFSQLKNMGYYVISKDINHGDAACCEFVIARLNIKATSTLRQRLFHHGCEFVNN